jgi:hypothetical protein
MKRSKGTKPPLPTGLNPNPRKRTKGGSKPDAPMRSVFRHFEEREIVALLIEIRGNSDRSACIILSSIIERALELTIVLRIEMGIEMEQPYKERLFGRDGALSTFSGNIQFARALGLITDDTFRNLNILRTIRNRFAHSPLPLSFKSDDIKDELAKMRYARFAGIAVTESLLEDIPERRKEFVLACFGLMDELDDSRADVDELKEKISLSLVFYDGLQVKPDA